MSSASTITRKFVDALIDHYQRFIRFPETEAESQEHINKFAERSDFPQVVGAIDGTHIEIKRPDENCDDYMNRKGYYSVLPQVIADADYKFLDVTAGYARSMHDARMLRVSSFFHKAQNRNVLDAPVENVYGTNVDPLIVGDGAYPLLPWLMKPYPHINTLNRSQRR